MTDDTGSVTIEIWPPRPTGGQVCGMISQGIRVTHYPSGIQATCETERSQHKNKAIAMSMIESALTHPFYRGALGMNAVSKDPSHG